MSTLLNELKGDLRAARKEWKEKKAFYKENQADIELVSKTIDLGTATSARMGVETYEVDLYASGNVTTLKEIYKGFRKLGYEPDDRPTAKPVSSFRTRFRQDGKADWYLSFSSTLCKRVKVGTKMVEQDIYEVVCE